ncbi:MAG TPA: hypothetical protein VNW74_16455, partial [Mycobacterium sp.]
RIASLDEAISSLGVLFAPQHRTIDDALASYERSTRVGPTIQRRGWPSGFGEHPAGGCVGGPGRIDIRR